MVNKSTFLDMEEVDTDVPDMYVNYL